MQIPVQSPALVRHRRPGPLRRSGRWMAAGVWPAQADGNGDDGEDEGADENGDDSGETGEEGDASVESE